MEFEKLKRIIAKVLNAEEADLRPETRLIDELGANSLSLLQLILEIEKEFEIEIDLADVSKLRTAADILAYL